jgi:peptide/nickel transport system permease protein
MQRMVLFVVQLALVVLGILTALFFLLRLSGDPALVILGAAATPDAVEQLREQLGLNEPLHVQYLLFLRQMLVLDFGTSITFNRPALEMVISKFPATLALATSTLVFSTLIALPLGCWTAARQNALDSRILVFIASIVQSMPSFWFGILLIIVFAVNLRMFPTFGSGELRHLVLPTITLSAFYIARLMRLIRAGMIEQLSSDYIRTARAKGLYGRIILFRHAFRNTLITVVTLITLDFSFLISGSVIVESLFGYNGIGRQLVDAINARDYPIVQATVFFVAIIVLLINNAADWLYQLTDPRVRHSEH